MKKLASATLLGFFVVSPLMIGSTAAQTAPPSATVVQLQPVQIATARRGSKVIGASVVNSLNQTVGKIDDILIRPDDRVLFAVLSVGGFLGIGDKLVVMPYDQLTMQGDKIMLPSATTETLKALPEFKYPS